MGTGRVDTPRLDWGPVQAGQGAGPGGAEEAWEAFAPPGRWGPPGEKAEARPGRAASSSAADRADATGAREGGLIECVIGRGAVTSLSVSLRSCL